MGTIWTFAAVAAIIGGAIIYQKPLTNILINLAQKAGQIPSTASPPFTSIPLPPPSSSPAAPVTVAAPSSPTPAPSTTSPTVATG